MLPVLTTLIADYSNSAHLYRSQNVILFPILQKFENKFDTML